MWKWVLTQRAWGAILRELCLKCNWTMHGWYLGMRISGEFPPPLEWFSVSKLFEQTMWYMLCNTCFPSENLEVWYMLMKQVPMWLAFSKTFGDWVYRDYFTHIVTTQSWKNQANLVCPDEEMAFGGLCLVSSGPGSMCFFLLLILLPILLL